jgi:8-oxo-dGTP pyrophosphatase MutT (NUDIX family)
MTVQPRLASTVMLLRDGVEGALEVFMVRRVVQSEFMPDLFVFPGGSVIVDDRQLEENPAWRVRSLPLRLTRRGALRWDMDCGRRRFANSSRRPMCCWPTAKD